MIRKIIQINESLCNGCGLCAQACHEGAIEMVNGKAKLMRDDYCDGLGDCLPACPTEAITFVEREAAPYNQQAVLEGQAAKDTLPCGCPGTHARSIARPAHTVAVPALDVSSQLHQWPVQIQLAPVHAPYFEGSHLLIAADCCAYAYGAFHQTFMEGAVTLIGCPKLDPVDYTEKLTEIISQNNIQSVTITRMEVPCCGGMEQAVKNALQASGKFLPWSVAVISTDGTILKK